jgi:hypothetical protein
MKKIALRLPGVVLALSALTSCGTSDPPVAPAPVPTATPVPTPPPPPPPRLSVIPPCFLPASNPGDSAVCAEHPSQLRSVVNPAIDRVITERPDLFDLEDVNGGPKVIKYDAYMTAVVAAINESGYCGLVGPEGEIGVKSSNGFSEQWGIMTSANYVRRRYIGDCSPATF